jgi:hypothetical protein
MTQFKSRAVMSLVELHEKELRRFLEVWERFDASGVALPATDDPSYKSKSHLVTHVVRAARNYLTWIGEVRKHPYANVDPETDEGRISARLKPFAESVLASWREHLASLEDSELEGAMFKSRWGEDYSVEQMLEHAVVHPMRHAIQLERLMKQG